MCLEKTSSTPLVTVSDLQRLKQWETIVLRIRMMPFKTKLTPNFKMDWGVNYPKATYPIHEKLPVKIFDLKGFVEKKREAKINNMLNGSNPGGNGLPIGGFGGGMGLSGGLPPGLPGMPPNPFGGSNPFGPANNKNNSFDIDEMVKRIDAKIAELEEEERQENAKKVENKSESKTIDNKQIPDVDTKVTPQNNAVEISKEPVTESKNNSNDSVTDDQFFDDFFSDD